MGHPEEKEKPVIYINCGIHAREWVTVSTCLWFIDQVYSYFINTLYYYLVDWNCTSFIPDGHNLFTVDGC